jgi:hypothetical protein
MGYTPQLHWVGVGLTFMPMAFEVKKSSQVSSISWSRCGQINALIFRGGRWLILDMAKQNQYRFSKESPYKLANKKWLASRGVLLLCWTIRNCWYGPFLNFIYLFIYCFIIHMCMQGLSHFSPLPPPPPLPPTPPPPSPRHPLNTQHKLFCPYL